jgi:hypothetical protein
MQYYRCKCGDAVAWSSMGTYPCEGCEKCNTTLEQHPDHHRTPEPHDWQLKYDENTGKPSYYRCTVCCKRKELGDAMADIGVD